MPHIERMKSESRELEEKIQNGTKFLNSENECPKFTNETQRQLLAIQLSYMVNYAETLKARIKYDENKK